MDKKVLVLAGGGAKGIVLVPFMANVERSTRNPIWQNYDLIVGSSVGAMMGAMMATGLVPADKIIKTYNVTCHKIFKRRWNLFKPFPLYGRDGFEDVWVNDFGIPADFKFGDVKTKLMITSINTVKNEYNCQTLKLWKSWDKEDAELPLMKIVETSFAAPMYFGHICDGNNVYSDGGGGYSNLPLDEAFTHILANGWDDFNCHIDAIGCLYGWPTPDEMTGSVVCKQKTLKQLLSFMNPAEGGLARAYSTLDQIRKVKYFTDEYYNVHGYESTVHLNYYDRGVPKSMDKIDALEYVDDGSYLASGRLMAINPLISVN